MFLHTNLKRIAIVFFIQALLTAAAFVSRRAFASGEGLALHYAGTGR